MPPHGYYWQQLHFVQLEESKCMSWLVSFTTWHICFETYRYSYWFMLQHTAYYIYTHAGFLHSIDSMLKFVPSLAFTSRPHQRWSLVNWSEKDVSPWLDGNSLCCMQALMFTWRWGVLRGVSTGRGLPTFWSKSLIAQAEWTTVYIYIYREMASPAWVTAKHGK